MSEDRDLRDGIERVRDMLSGDNFFQEFDDASVEWKRIIAEIVGTFFLVLAAAGTPAFMKGAGEPIVQFVAATVPGLVLIGLIYMLAELSGAHFNPAVTFAFALRRDFPWRRVPGYLIGQFVGALAAAGFIAFIVGPATAAGANVPGPHMTALDAVMMEAALTMGLVLIILGTASGAKIVGHNAAIAVGAYVAAAGMLGGPVSGGSMNPARSLAPDIVTGAMGTSWVYIVGPLAGAALGVGIARLLRRHRSEDEIAAAQGAGAKKPGRLTRERSDG